MRTVNAERLRQLGFDEDLIEDAKRYEATGLLEIEPSPDHLERLIEACRPQLEEVVRKLSIAK